MKYLTYDSNTQTELVKYSTGFPVIRSVGKSTELMSWMDDESLNQTIDLNALNVSMELDVSSNRFKRKDGALKVADYLINQSLQNGDDLDHALIEIKKEVDDYLQD